jgi:diazepam-binding inhibitor (GABA receptor modulator, acyl-CoA-binding protein)
MSLDAQFEAAMTASKSIKERPDNDTLLSMYALFKQGSSGDAATSGTKRPGFTDPIGRAKWDAWNKLAGTDGNDAKQQYVDLVNGLL